MLARWIAARDKRTLTSAKIVSATVAAYALSPIDLIPDFIPILGYLDDLIVVPLGVLLAVRLIPPQLMVEFRTLVTVGQGRPMSRAGLIAICSLWLTMAAVAGLTALKYLNLDG